MGQQKQISEREKDQQRLLEEALNRPGMAEYMKVYRWWEKQDQGFAPYQVATTKVIRFSATDHVNADSIL